MIVCASCKHPRKFHVIEFYGLWLTPAWPDKNIVIEEHVPCPSIN